MKKLIFILLISCLYTLNLNAQAWQYAKSFGGQSGSTSLNNNMPHNMEVDDEGNSYVFGTYGAGTQFNDSTLKHYYDGARGSFIAKYNCAGEVEWFKGISNSEQYDDQAAYMVLKDDFIYLSGSFKISSLFKTWYIDTLVIGSILNLDYPNNSVYPWVPYRKYTYMIKMDLQGNIVDQHLLKRYSKDIETRDSFSSLWGGLSDPKAFGIDHDGNYYMFTRISQEHSGTISCDNEAITDTIIPEYNKLQYLLKFDANFNFLWYKSFVQGVSDPDNAAVDFNFQDIRFDLDNNFYMVGYAKTVNNSGTESFPTYIDLGNDQQITTYSNNGTSGFVLKMDSEGEVQWCQQAKQYSNNEIPSSSHFKTLVLDEASNCVYVQGITTPVTNFFPLMGTIFGVSDTIINNLEWAQTTSDFIAKYDMDGHYKWVTTPQTLQSFSSSLALHDNKLYSGMHWAINFQHGEDYYETPSKGLAICVWDTAGNAIQSINIPSTCSGEYDLMPYDTRVNSRGEITLTGTYDYNLTFGEHEIYGEGFKMFIAKYGKACPVVLDEDEAFCYGDTYRDTVLTQTGNYQFVVETELADSVINLHAEVNPELTTGIADTTLCADDTHLLEAIQGYDTYEWSTGSTTYQENLSFDNAGTETIYVNLTQGNCSGTDTITIVVDVCGQVKEGNSELDINIYPVPAQSFLKVDLPKETEISTYSIYNMQGQKLLQKAINSEGQKLSIGIEDLPVGSYILYLQGAEQVYRAGFVKK